MGAAHAVDTSGFSIILTRAIYQYGGEIKQIVILIMTIGRPPFRAWASARERYILEYSHA